MTGLPDADHRAVGLNLIDVTPFDPDILSGVHRRRHDRRGDNRRSSDNRRSGNDSWRSDNGCYGTIYDRIGDYAADYTADETGPEIPAATTPGAAMAMTMHRTRDMMMANDTGMTAGGAAMPSCECRSCAKRDCDTDCCDFYHFIHIAPSLSPHLAVTVW